MEGEDYSEDRRLETELGMADGHDMYGDRWECATRLHCQRKAYPMGTEDTRARTARSQSMTGLRAGKVCFVPACFLPNCAQGEEVPRPVMGPGVVCGAGPGAGRRLPMQAPMSSGRKPTVTSTPSKRGTSQASRGRTFFDSYVTALTVRAFQILSMAFICIISL